MSISVHCESCGKTYHVRDEMAGRKGKCPRGHTLHVPVLAQALPEEGNAFTFTDDAASTVRDDAPPTKPAGKPKERRSRDQYPVATPAPASTPADHDDEFSFPTSPATEVDEGPAPRSGRYRKDKSVGKPMIPMLIGGVVAILGVGGGLAMFFMARSEVAPLREQAAAAAKKAEDADSRAKTAEAVAAAAEAKLPELQKTVAARDAALKTAQEKATAAERKLAKAEKEQKAAEVAKPAAAPPTQTVANKGPAGPARPNVTAKAPDGATKGGKNWTVPASLMHETVTHKPGDRLVISPKEDKPLKADKGKLKIKFHYEVPKGKQLPGDLSATLHITQAGSSQFVTVPLKFKSPNGDAEAAFDVKGYSGSGQVTFFLSDGNVKNGSKSLKVYSNFVAMPADF